MKRYLKYSGFACVSLLVTSSVTFAQNAGAVTSQAPGFMEDVFNSAGLIGWIIVAISVVAAALAIENFMTLKRDKLAPPHLIDEIEALLDEEKFQEAVEVCEAEPCYMTDIVGSGLTKLGHNFDTIQIAYEEMHEEHDIKINAKVGWLSLIAAVAPMMGLLGTVNGMITTFGEIASKPTVKASDLAGGIKGALVTTLLGLTVAIPVTALYVYFKNKTQMLSLEVGAIIEELFERFRQRPGA